MKRISLTDRNLVASGRVVEIIWQVSFPYYDYSDFPCFRIQKSTAHVSHSLISFGISNFTFHDTLFQRHLFFVFRYAHL